MIKNGGGTPTPLLYLSLVSCLIAVQISRRGFMQEKTPSRLENLDFSKKWPKMETVPKHGVPHTTRKMTIFHYPRFPSIRQKVDCLIAQSIFLLGNLGKTPKWAKSQISGSGGFFVIFGGIFPYFALMKPPLKPQIGRFKQGSKTWGKPV